MNRHGDGRPVRASWYQVMTRRAPRPITTHPYQWSPVCVRVPRVRDTEVRPRRVAPRADRPVSGRDRVRGSASRGEDDAGDDYAPRQGRPCVRSRTQLLVCLGAATGRSEPKVPRTARSGHGERRRTGCDPVREPSRGQFVTTLGPAATKHCAAGASAHSAAKTVLLRALAVVGLERTLHVGLQRRPRYRVRPQGAAQRRSTLPAQRTRGCYPHRQ